MCKAAAVCYSQQEYIVDHDEHLQWSPRTGHPTLESTAEPHGSVLETIGLNHAITCDVWYLKAANDVSIVFGW